MNYLSREQKRGGHSQPKERKREEHKKREDLQDSARQTKSQWQVGKQP